MTGIEPEEVKNLVDTLKKMQLPPAQRDLLDAITTVAGDIQDRPGEGGERAFSADFGDAFTKKQADLVLEYVAVRHTGIIKRAAAQPPAIIRKPAPDSPGIIRRPPTPPHDDDQS